MALNKSLRSIPLGFDSAFPKREFDGRVRRLQAAMDARGFDLYLTSGPENIFYLTGHQTPGYYMFQCLGVPVDGKPFLLVRRVESFVARANTYLSDIHDYTDDQNPAAVLASLLKRKWRRKRVAIDQDAFFLTVNLFKRLVKDFGSVRDGARMVEAMRRVKSSLELTCLAKAAEANDAGMRAGVAATRAGVTENDIAAAIMEASIAAGSEQMGMEPQVNSGPRSGLPHATWRRRRIERGDLLIFETAGCYNRYHAALQRTVGVGNFPARARDMFKICREGLEVVIDAIKPGVTCSEVYEAGQSVVKRHGLAANRPSRMGYSMGISFAPDWGEGNILQLYHDTAVVLEPGMAFHVPFAFRNYGQFGVGVSDTIVVTERGSKPLSQVPRQLFEA